MPYTTLSLGLTLTIPTNGSRNWGPTLLNTTWTKISNHQHTGSGDGNKMVTNSYTDNSVTLIKMHKAAGFFVYSTILLPVGMTQTIDWSNGSFQILDLDSATGDVTLTLDNPLSGALYRIKVIQGATPRDLIYPAAVKWPQGQKPILTQTNNAIDIIELFYDGTNYFGAWENDFS
jgi:hypothetical protein